MPRKTIIPLATTLPLVEAFQRDLGLVRSIETKTGRHDYLTSTESGRVGSIPLLFSGVRPPRGSRIGWLVNLIAVAAGLTDRSGQPISGGKADGHKRKIDRTWRWYPSGPDLLRTATKTLTDDQRNVIVATMKGLGRKGGVLA